MLDVTSIGLGQRPGIHTVVCYCGWQVLFCCQLLIYYIVIALVESKKVLKISCFLIFEKQLETISFLLASIKVYSKILTGAFNKLVSNHILQNFKHSPMHFSSSAAICLGFYLISAISGSDSGKCFVFFCGSK